MRADRQRHDYSCILDCKALAGEEGSSTPSFVGLRCSFDGLVKLGQRGFGDVGEQCLGGLYRRW